MKHKFERFLSSSLDLFLVYVLARFVLIDFIYLLYIYFVVFPLLIKGRTFGHIVFKLYVNSVSGEVSYKQIFIRQSFSIFSLPLFFVEILSLYKTTNNLGQFPHEVVSKTIVSTESTKNINDNMIVSLSTVPLLFSFFILTMIICMLIL